jgi:N-acetylneuraminic acid mutarotase
MEHSLFSVERLNLKTGIWEYISNVNIARTKFGVVAYKNRMIYALGGKLQDATRTDIVEEYDVKLDRWITSSWTLPKPRSGFASCIVNDTQIFIVGGNDGSVLD